MCDGYRLVGILSVFLVPQRYLSTGCGFVDILSASEDELIILGGAIVLFIKKYAAYARLIGRNPIGMGRINIDGTFCPQGRG